jgi:hypothetical protein
MADDTGKKLEELTRRLSRMYGDALITVILYGSAATGEMDPKFSDLNVLCVLRKIGPGELASAEPVFQWWRSLGNPAPLLLTLDEIHNGTDCFPIEFHDIQQNYRVLSGEDIVQGLVIDDRFYRGQVEHELRAKLLRLRQKAGGVLHDKATLLRLMADSVSTFCNLARHALRLAGENAPVGKREAIGACARVFGVKPETFYTLLDLRAGVKPARELDPPALLGAYMSEIEVLTRSVDQLASKENGKERS